MNQPRTGIATALLAVGIASCSSTPPGRPDVDESGRRPANSASAVEAELCRGQLAEAHGELSEARKLAEASSSALAQATVEELRRPAQAPAPPHSLEADRARGNTVWTLRFAFNSSRIDADPGELRQVVEAAKEAAYVVVKGRTDGVVETRGESAIARRRMAAMYGVLLKGGVDPHRIALQYQPVGDRVAENDTDEGRAANRRAEVELYALAPERFLVHGAPPVDPSDMK